MTLPKARELRSLTVPELRHKREALEKDLFELQRKKVTGQLDKPHLFRTTRRQIAQLNTLMREKAHV